MLRDYQSQAINEIRSHYANGRKKVLLWLATGSGKTLIFSEILKSLYEKNKFGLMAVRGRKLVDQAHKRLLREKVPHGVLMAGHSHYFPNERIQLASIDTLRSRQIYPRAELVVIDEAHLATSKSYLEFCARYPDAFFLPVTATPFCEKSLRHCADVIVSPISIAELTEQKYLVPARLYAPVQVDLSKIKIDSKTKDYNQRELSDHMDKLKLVGDIVESWKKYGENRPTLCFAVTVKHSMHIVEEFCKAGIPAVHCDANSPDLFREHCLQRLERGEIKIISNVGLFGVGVDLPSVSCLVLARPTQSLNLYLQQIGRGLRPFTKKENCIVLDHAENIMRHGHPSDPFEPALDGKLKKLKPSLKRCEECFAIIREFPCVYCGYEKQKAQDVGERKILHVEGELQEVTQKKVQVASPAEIRAEIERLDSIAAARGFKTGWLWHQLKNKYGSQVAKFYLSGRFIRGPRAPS